MDWTVTARLRRWLFRRLGGDDEGEGAAFAGSLLDASVNYSHGQSDGEAVRELQKASEETSKLRDADDRRP